jgi:multidrug resistance efflux pump
MATIHEESRIQQSLPSAESPAAEPEFQDFDRSNHQPGPRVLRTRSGWGGKVLVLLVVLGGLGVAGYMAWPQIAGALGGSEQATTAALHTVDREDLRVTIPDDGEVESASNVDVKCRVAGGSTILWIVPDGTIVTEGQEIVRLDQAAIEDLYNTQKGVYSTALAAHIKAGEDYEAAAIAVDEYVKGTFLKELQTIESQITVAQQNLSSAQDLLEHTERMVRKNFATPLQLEADQFAVDRAKIDLKTAEITRSALVDFTKPKTVKTLEATRDAAAALRDSAAANLALEEAKLKRLESQLKNCVIIAPQSGMVVYANEQSRRSNTQTNIEEGASVLDGRTILRIPDLTSMQVKVTIHESRIDQIRIGMPAQIKIGDRDPMMGHVLSISNQPENANWFSANVKEYATVVKIEGESSGLKPGMTAIVDIEIADLKDVLTVPVSAVVEQRGRFYAWVHTAKGPERRPLLLGLTNDKKIEIRDGLSEGEMVYLNPRAAVVEAREELPEETQGATPGGPAETPSGGGPPGSDAGTAGPGATSASPAGGPSGGPGGPAGADRAGGPAGPGGPGGPGGRRPGFSFADMDKNSDGKLTVEELPERMQEYFSNIDSNGDGSIDQKELTEMRNRMRAAGAGGPGGPGGGPGRPGGP